MPLFSNRIKEQLLIFDNQKPNSDLFSFFSNMLLNIHSFQIQHSTQYNQSYSRKIQIDNVVIMNTFRKAISILSYSFITSRITGVYY